jgi:hypothetical protein
VCCIVCSVLLVMQRIFNFIFAYFFLSNDAFRIEEKSEIDIMFVLVT